MERSTEQVNIVEYLDYIGADKNLNNYTNPSFETLNNIVNRHAITIPYQNYDLLKSKAIFDLSLQALQKKLIHERKGGMCYETSELLYHVLKHLGFEIYRIAVYVLLMRPNQENVGPATHNILIVKINQKKFLIDVGFGYNSIRCPVEFTFDSTEEKTILEYERYQLFCKDKIYQLNVWLNSSWVPFYYFNRPLKFIDFEETMENYQKLIQYPGLIPIRDSVIKLGFITEKGRLAFICSYNKENKELKYVRFQVNADTSPNSITIDCETFCKTIEKYVSLEVPNKNMLTVFETK